MKSNTRRHIASLSFIALLAIIYLVILMVGKNDGNVINAISPPEKHPAADTTVAVSPSASAALSDTATAKPDKTKSASAKKKARKPPRPAPEDIPDVFDRPVPPIEKNIRSKN